MLFGTTQLETQIPQKQQSLETDTRKTNNV